MSTQALKAVATGQAATVKDQVLSGSIAGMMSDPKVKAQLALALPKHLTAERLARIALTEIRKNPKLGKCDQASFLGSIMQCAQLGLEPGGALGHAYLLPFENKRKNIIEVQFIIGYRGMIDLARRSGQIISISAHTVHENDKFSYEFGLHEDLKHIPADGERGRMTHVYAVARLKDDGVQFEVMSKLEVDKIRAQSKSGSGPWSTHYDEMAKKTVIRRLFKYLPVSIEMTRAVIADEAADAGISQDNAHVITGEFSVVDQPEEDFGEIPETVEVVDTETGEVLNQEQPETEQKVQKKAETVPKNEQSVPKQQQKQPEQPTFDME